MVGERWGSELWAVQWVMRYGRWAMEWWVVKLGDGWWWCDVISGVSILIPVIVVRVTKWEHEGLASTILYAG